MRLAALAVPASTGSFTENGNQIGTITIGGSLGLIVFVGLLAGLAAGIVWVTISPWITGTGIRRAVLTMPIAIALSGFFLIEGDNHDFAVLGHDTLVVGLLVVLIALIGATIALTDDWLDRRLPRGDAGASGAVAVYLALTCIGLLMLPLVLGPYIVDDRARPVGVALVATGAATVIWWGLRLRGHRQPPLNLVVAGRAGLLAAVVLGTDVLVPEVLEALGAS